MELTDLPYIVKPTDVDEDEAQGKSPKDTVEFLSRIKAQPLISDVKNNDIIIGSDTVVAIDDEILGKPENEKDAYNMLKKLSGKTHSVFTGVTIIKKGEKKNISKTFSCETKVTFYKLSDKEINNYIATGEPLDKAGAYGIQERGSLFVKKINGDFFNVVGLPIGKLKKEIKKIEEK